MSIDTGVRYRDLFPARVGHPSVKAPTLARYRYPSEIRLMPKRCTHCGAALIRSDVPTPEHPVADQSCLLCSRTAFELIADGWRPGVLS